jgi:uncharacterized membrane protein
MKKTGQLILMAVLGIGFIALVAILYPKLPANVPMQWGLNGKVNYSLPKLPVVVIMVLVESAFGLYTAFLHRKASKIPNKDFFTALVFPLLFSFILLLTQIRF